MIKNIFKKIIKHKLIAGTIIVAIGLIVFWGVKVLSGKAVTTSYITATVEKGTVISSVSGTGQVESLNQTDIKSEVSGEIIYLGISNGQSVGKGALVVKVDDSDARDTIEAAQDILEEELFTLEKMEGLTTSSGSLRGDKEKAMNNLDKAYEDGFNTVSNAFLQLPAIITGLYDIIYSKTFSVYQDNVDYYGDIVESYGAQYDVYRTDAFNEYKEAKALYDINFQDYKAVSRSSDDEDIEALIEETYETARDISDAIKNTINLITIYQEKLKENGLTPVSGSTTHLSSLNTYTSNANNHVSSLLSSKNSIQSYKEAVIEVDFDLEDQKEKVEEARQDLSDAQDDLSEYNIYAPFSGTISSISAEKGDSINSGSTMATIITHNKVAAISLNEVDAADVKVGQKAVLTFDAIDDLSITGQVLEIDSVGTVSQGVVSYSATISFDTDNESVKPGMTVSATIILEVKQNVLLVSNSAIKSNDDISYVEIMDASSTTFKQQQVEIGLSDDDNTEIVSGLNEGDIVITKTTSSSKTNSNSSSGNTIFSNGEGPSGVMPGGATMIIR